MTGRGRSGLCTGPSGPRGRLDFPVMTFLPRILSPLALVAAGGLLLGACSSDAGSDTDDTAAPAAVAETVPTAADLSDAVYDLSEITGHTLVADSTVELVFDSGTVSVHAGCNRMFGAFSIDDGALETPQLAATLMACDQALMDQDQWMAGFLESAPQIRTGEDTLVLTGGDTALTFTRTDAGYDADQGDDTED